jgi:hypothetical protein
MCALDNRNELATLNTQEFVRRFVSDYLSNAVKSHVNYHLFIDFVYEENTTLREALEVVWRNQLIDPSNASAPGNANPRLYKHLDPMSIWIYWERRLTNPFQIDTGADGSNSPTLASGYVYDLRSMTGFEPPRGDVQQKTKDLLREACVLRIGSIPPKAFVQINFPPFVALVLEEARPYFVMVEALDKDNRSFPIHLFPYAIKWTAPITGCGPSDDDKSWEQVRDVLVVMSAAALRDFWVIEDRQRTLGPPRLSRIFGSRSSLMSDEFCTAFLSSWRGGDGRRSIAR